MGKIKLRKVGASRHRPDESTYFPVWGMHIPSFRTGMAEDRGTLNNFLIATWGGVGDVACAEPAIRYGIREYAKRGVKFSLATHHPDFFQHLPFEQVFDLKDKKNYPTWQKYFVFKTIYEETHLQWEFMNHMLCNSVDYISLNMWRQQMPIRDRAIEFYPIKPDDEIYNSIDKLDRPYCLVHPGKHWQVKTFPKAWWDEVLSWLIADDVIPVLIGAHSIIASNKNKDGTYETTGTVDVNRPGCLDLRNKTSINDLIWLCQNSPVLLSNDSSPIHIAASGKAWIGYVATIKHPDYLMHWRRTDNNSVHFAWRMRDFGLGGVWDLPQSNHCPNNTKHDSGTTEVPEDVLMSWLPDPKNFARWGADRAQLRNVT